MRAAHARIAEDEHTSHANTAGTYDSGARNHGMRTPQANQRCEARAYRLNADGNRKLVWVSVSWEARSERRGVRHGRIHRRASHSSVRDLGTGEESFELADGGRTHSGSRSVCGWTHHRSVASGGARNRNVGARRLEGKADGDQAAETSSTTNDGCGRCSTVDGTKRRFASARACTIPGNRTSGTCSDTGCTVTRNWAAGACTRNRDGY